MREFHASRDMFRLSDCSCSITGQDEFTDRDMEVFRRYLTFCGIGENFFRFFGISLAG